MTQPYPQYQPHPGGYPMPPQPPYSNGGGYPSQPVPPTVTPYGGYTTPAPQSAPPAPVAPQPPAMGGGQGITPPMPTLRDGGSNGGAAAPKMRHLVGRTIIVEPVRMQRGKNQETGQEVDEAVFHLTVVDGGPLRYGDNQSRDVSKQRPNTHEIDTPCRFTNVTDFGFGFVQAVREALDAGEPGRVGVVQQGTQGNRPFLITKTSTDVHGNERPDGEARFAAAMELFGKIWADKHSAPGAPKQFVSPTPRSLVAPGPAAGAAPQVNYGAPAAPQPAYAPAGAYAPNGYTYGQQPPAPPQPSAYAAAAAPEMAAAYGAPPAGQLPPHIEAWLATLPPEQQAVQRAALIASAPPAYAPPQQPQGPGI